jgi:hypothetical protein
MGLRTTLGASAEDAEAIPPGFITTSFNPATGLYAVSGKRSLDCSHSPAIELIIVFLQGVFL